MNSSARTLNEAELDLVAGGVRDDPWSDARNQQTAALNGAVGFGGSLNSIFINPKNGSLGGNPF